MDGTRPGAQPDTTVVLCANLDTLGRGLDRNEIRDWLHASIPSVHVRTVADLCGRPSGIARAVERTADARLVLGMCCGNHGRADLQPHLRRIGADPLGVEVLNLGAYAVRVYPRQQATERAKILLAGAVAKVRAFQGSRPENSKPLVPAVMDRRSLLTLSLLEYQAVPAIQTERCHVDRGCRQCVRACPHEALRIDDDAIRLEKPRCTTCGVCVTACPHDAVDLPGYTPAQLSAQVAALLGTGHADQPRSIVFVCQETAAVLERLARRGISCPANWLPVEVPCVSMVPPVWLLGCLTQGAAAVGVLPCANQCRSAGRRPVEETVGYCRALLHALGELDDRIMLLPTDEPQLIEALPALPAAGGAVRATGRRQVPWAAPPFAAGMRARVLLRLAQEYGADRVFTMAHPHSPFGVVEISRGCTTCGACAAACPAGALALEHRQEDATVTFDAALCTACGECVPACPEASIGLRRITNLACLSGGRVALFRDRLTRCRSCGQPIASEAMVNRVAALLEGQPAGIAGLIAQYCADCRTTWSPPPYAH